MRSCLTVSILWTLSLLLGVSWRHYTADSPTQLIEQAQKHAIVGDMAQAELALRRAIARAPRRTDARLLLAKLCHDRSRPKTVAAVLRDVPDSDPMAGPIRVAEGDAWLSLNQARLAEDCWSRASHLAPDDPQPRRRLIYLYAMQLRRDLWAKLLWELYDDGQAGLREMIQLMIAQHVVWAPEESLARLQALAHADARDIHSRRALAEYQLLSGDIPSAMDGLDSILRTTPVDIPSRLLLIECHLANADTEQARKALGGMPPEASSLWQTRKLRGSVLLLEQRYEAATAEFRQALAEAPFDRELHYKTAQALRLAGQFDAAEKHAQIADRLAKVHRLCHTIHSQPTPNLVHLRQLVQLCEELALIEEAVGWVRVALAQHPNDSFLSAARERLAGMQHTSSRSPQRVEGVEEVKAR